MHNENIIINGKNLADFQTWWDGSQVYRRGARQIERLEVPGRNGDVIISKGKLENIIIPFNCFIKENFRENYTALMDYLNNLEGYVELRTTEEPNCYREAYFRGTVEPTMTPHNQAGQFTLEFDCKPQLWLDEGQRWFEATNGTLDLYNETNSKAYPLFMIEAGQTSGIIEVKNPDGTIRGRITLTTGDVYIEALEGTADVYRETSEGRINKNLDAIFASGDGKDFTLKPGLNKLRMTEGIKVKPRWYRL